MMHHIEIIGHERVRLPDGQVLTGGGAEYEAARVLIGQGINPAERMALCRDGKPVMAGSIHHFARQAWAGAERDPATVKWRPHPRAELPLPLVRWHAETVAAEVAARVVAEGREGGSTPRSETRARGRAGEAGDAG